MSNKQKDIKEKELTTQSKKPLFNWCGCGDNQKKQQVILDLRQKQPETFPPTPVPQNTQPTPLNNFSTFRPSSPYQRPSSVSKPRITFTYSSPSQPYVLPNMVTQKSQIVQKVGENAYKKQQEGKQQQPRRQSIQLGGNSRINKNSSNGTNVTNNTYNKNQSSEIKSAVISEFVQKSNVKNA